MADELHTLENTIADLQGTVTVLQGNVATLHGSLDRRDRGKGKGKGKQQRDGSILEDRSCKDIITKMSEILKQNTTVLRSIKENQENAAQRRPFLQQGSRKRKLSETHTEEYKRKRAAYIDSSTEDSSDLLTSDSDSSDSSYTNFEPSYETSTEDGLLFERRTAHDYCCVSRDRKSIRTPADHYFPPLRLQSQTHFKFQKYRRALVSTDLSFPYRGYFEFSVEFKVPPTAIPLSNATVFEIGVGETSSLDKNASIEGTDNFVSFKAVFCDIHNKICGTFCHGKGSLPHLQLSESTEDSSFNSTYGMCIDLFNQTIVILSTEKVEPLFCFTGINTSHSLRLFCGLGNHSDISCVLKLHETPIISEKAALNALRQRKMLNMQISTYLACHPQFDEKQKGTRKCLLYSLEYLDCAQVSCHLESKRSLNCTNTFRHINGSSTMQYVMDITKETKAHSKADVPVDACCRLRGVQKIIEKYFEYTKTETTDVNYIFENKETLLHYSFRTNNLILSAFLLHRNADLTVVDGANFSPLQHVSKDEIQFTKDIVERVIYKKICKQQIADPRVVRISLCRSTETDKFVIMVYQSGSAISTVSESNGLELIWRLFFGADDEGRVISNYIKTIEITNILPRIPSQMAQTLFKEHSNLTMISPSYVTSSGYKSEDHVIRKSACVVLYCKAKGYKPVGENLFPRQLCGYRTDVREGNCQFGMTENLQIGSPISKNIWGGSNKSGTVGGFIELGHNKTGLITCSHVLYSLSELKHGNLKPRINVTSPPNAFDCGLVREARFFHGKPNEVSVDAALIEVTSRCPTSGSFPDIDDVQLRVAGFSKQNPPVFSSGEVMLDVPDDCRRNHVVKYGQTTKFTSGTLTLEFSHVRFEHIDLSVNEKSPFNNDMIKSFRMFHQNEIYSRNNESFFDCGDSGAFVYLLKDNNEKQLKCIGMAIGRTSHNACIMTPIRAVLDAFKLPYTLKVFPSEPDPVAGNSHVSSTLGVDKLDLILSAVQQSNNKLQRLDSIENHMQNIDRRVSTLERQSNGRRNDDNHAVRLSNSISLESSGYSTDT